jgi:hypothetical protein
MLLAILSVLQSVGGPLRDTTVYADSATAQLVARAMERHANADEEVQDYRAMLRYRVSFGFGRRIWARVPNASVEEQEARVHWSAPNDLRLEVLGRRAKARSEELNISSVFDRPWFVPRSLGDSVQVFGQDFPERAALHPLAADGPSWYHYALIDSVTIITPDGSTVRLLEVDVVPRRKGESLIAGRMWLDQRTAEVVRLGFRYVGTELWVKPDGETRGDSSDARRANKIINRVLSLEADLEYSLQETRWWMPYRQTISGRVELPWFGELVIPFQASTTFDDYEINTGQPVRFSMEAPDSVTDPDSINALVHARLDSLRKVERERRKAGGKLKEDDLARDDTGRWPGGRFEIHRPPADSLKAYGEWGDSLEFDDDPALDRQQRELASDLERMAAELPTDLTGRPKSGFGWERLSDLVRYNRVQGFSTGFAYKVQAPGDPFLSFLGEIRYGFSDERLTGGLTITREAPGARWRIRGYREITTAAPFSRAHNLGNSFGGIFAAHDDADYYLAEGGAISRESSLGLGLELTTTARVEVQHSVRTEATSGVNDFLGGSGEFPDNPPIVEGTFGGLGAEIDAVGLRTRWRLGADVLGGADKVVGRLFGSVRMPLGRNLQLPIILLKGGVATSDELPQQNFPLGGVPTVHGFDYGTRGGQSFWAAQMNWPLTRGLIRPVLFADAGQAGDVSGLFSTPVLAGGGLGLSLFGSILRFDLSYPFTDGGDGVRLDIRTGLGW